MIRRTKQNDWRHGLALWLASVVFLPPIYIRVLQGKGRDDSGKGGRTGEEGGGKFGL